MFLGTEKQLRAKLYKEVDTTFEDKKVFVGEDFREFINYDLKDNDLLSYDVVSRMTEDDYWEEARTGFNIGSHYYDVIFDDQAELRIELDKDLFIERILLFERRARKVLLDIKNGNVDVGNVLELK